MEMACAEISTRSLRQNRCGCDPVSDAIRYRDALQWAFGRLSIDGGMTAREQQLTYREIGNVLLGRPTPEIDGWRRRLAAAASAEDDGPVGVIR